MASFFRRRAKGRVFDVRVSGKNSFKKWMLFWRSGGVVDLRYRRYRLFATIGIFVLVLLSFFTLRSLLTQAEVAEFYPQNCLGTWQNPEKAVGKPEKFSDQDALISSENSALFADSSNQIFCGQFIPDEFDARGSIKNASLSLVWNIEALGNSDQGIEVIETPINIENDNNGDAGTIQEQEKTAPESELSPTEESGEPAPPEGSTRLRFLPIELAHAQTTSSDESLTEADPNPENQTETAAETPTEEKPEVSAAPVIENQSSPPSEEIINSQTPAPSEEPEAPSDQNIPTEESGDKKSLDEVQSTEELLEILVPQVYEPNDDFLKISYSLDGQDWLELQTIGPWNWQNFTTRVPLTSWEDFKKLQISIEGIPTTLSEIPQVLLDGLLVEVHYDLPPILGTKTQKPEIPVPLTPEETKIIELAPNKSPAAEGKENKSFRLNETPRFDFDLELLPIPEPNKNPEPGGESSLNRRQPSDKNGDVGHRRFSFNLLKPSEAQAHETALKTVKNLKKPIFDFSFKRNLKKTLEFFGIATAEAGDTLVNPQNPIFAQIIDPENRPTNLKPILLTANNKLRISVPEPEESFKPGKYRLELWILKNGVIYHTQTDFTWGVLVVNFSKSVYKLGNRVVIGYGVLDDRGFTICDAKVETRILDPAGNITNLSTEDATITRSETCGPITITNEPDYISPYRATQAGTYDVFVRAETKNGTREITDSFRVEDPPAFDIERFLPTRVYPPATYKAVLKIMANQNFEGEITETVPSSFNLITERVSTETTNGFTKNISWPVDLRAGDEIELKYFFDPPDVSPELHKLGPLELKDERGELVFSESRSWQIASDASGDIILFWDGDVIPTGWDCLSCDNGDPFIDVYPLASSTYGSASSSNHTAQHDLTNASDGGSNQVVPDISTGSAGIISTHAHTGWGNISSTVEDVQPSHRGLKMISAATTSIPNGAIGIFDISSSSLPSDWTYYSALEEMYAKGSSTVGNAGTSTHSHMLSNDEASDSYSTLSVGTAGRGGSNASGAPHSHTISSSTVIGYANNSPSFIAVVFGQTTATTTLGSGSDGLIAMFDNTTLPTDWSIISTSGSAYAGNLLYGSSTFGATGGSATHNHTGVLTTQSSSDDPTSITSGGVSGVNITHAHDITYTVSTESILPIYREIILGQYTATTPIAVQNVTINPNPSASSSITLTANATTTITAVASTSIAATSATGTLYRSSISGGADCAADDQNCYQISSCALADSDQTVQCSADIWYFADATDASSSYPSDSWMAQITATDGSTFDTSSTVEGETSVELNTLLAINVATSGINYGTLENTTGTEAANQRTQIENVGNSSSGLNVQATAFIFSVYEISTSSQRFATSSFVLGVGDTAIAETDVLVVGFLVKPKTSSGGHTVSTWVETTALGFAVARHSATAHRGYLYTSGGVITTDPFSTSSVFYTQINADGTVGSWVETTALPNTLTEHALLSNSGYLYAVGGGGETVLFASVNSDGTVNAWAETTALPAPYTRVSGDVRNGYIYLPGSHIGSAATSTVVTSKINADGTVGAWTETTVLPSPIGDSAVVATDGYLYVIGGRNVADSVTTSVKYATINGDGTVGAWSEASALPVATRDGEGFYHGDYLYFIGGDYGGTATTSVYYAKTNADGTLDAWTITNPLPNGLNRHAVATYNGYGYSVGGYIFVGSGQVASTTYTDIVNGRSFGDVFWGIEITGGQPEGTYVGTTTFNAAFSE